MTKSKKTPPARHKSNNTKQNQLDNENMLRPLFNNFVPIRKAAEITNLEKSTVNKYYKKFSEDLINTRDEQGYTLDEKQQIAKEKALGILSSIVIELQNFRAKIQKYEQLYEASTEEALSKGKLQLPNMVYFLANKKLETIRYLTEILEIVHKVNTMPTIDEQASYVLPGLVKKSNDLIDDSNIK
jgi:hypothetical protein